MRSSYMRRNLYEGKPHLEKIQKRRQKRRRRNMIIILTVSAMAFVILGTVLTVKSQSSQQISISDQAYKELEKEYVDHVRQLLTEKGYDNSGVTLTKEYREDGTRNYDVLIHHKRITALPAEEQELLKEELSKVPFPVPGCDFGHQFLVRT